MILQTRTTKNCDTLFLVLFWLLFAYVFIRAICIEITHDEAYSFYNVKHFWWVETLCTGNTHWFNFVAIKTAVLFGFEKAFQLRWFTILSASIFFIIGYRWIKTIDYLPLKLLAFSIAFLNPYFLDYFSLARGYVTGLAFVALALFFFIRALKKDLRNYYWLSLFFAGMSAVANFNFFYFFSAFTALYFYNYYFKKGFNFIKDKRFYLEVFFSIGITVLVLKALWFITDCSNDISAYGGQEFVDSLFSGYIRGFIYGKIALSDTMLRAWIYIVFVIIMGSVIYGVFYLKKHQNKLYQVSSILILIMFSLCVINKIAFNVLYPVNRTTLMFFPLFTIVIIGFLQSILKNTSYKKYLFLGLAIVFLTNFVMSINLVTTLDYYEQIDARKSFKELEKLNVKKAGIAPYLYGVYRNYYQQTCKYQFPFYAESINTLMPVGTDQVSNKLTEFDYLILLPPYNLSFYQKNNVSFKAVKFYPRSKTLIVEVLTH